MDILTGGTGGPPAPRQGAWGAAPPIFLYLILTLSSCISIVEQSGRILDGPERTEAVFRLDTVEVRQIRGDPAIVITLDGMPGLRLYGSQPGIDGSFSLLSCSFVTSNYSGWNEFSRELAGSGTFWVNGGKALFRLDPGLEALDIREGRIRRADSRLYGEPALTALRNRDARISELAAWMRSAAGGQEFPDQAGFEAYWQGILYPELVSPKRRPASWDQEPPEWVRALDVRWNTSYTRRVFPEALRELRDSGTLLRDWEEAAAWIYLEFAWDRIITPLSHEMRLLKTK